MRMQQIRGVIPFVEVEKFKCYANGGTCGELHFSNIATKQQSIIYQGNFVVMISNQTHLCLAARIFLNLFPPFVEWRWIIYTTCYNGVSSLTKHRLKLMNTSAPKAQQASFRNFAGSYLAEGLTDVTRVLWIITQSMSIAGWGSRWWEQIFTRSQ